tara:strand:- start:1980 stop:2246 length:267 start_codon:yes stop_codon:yes gene_type:complete
MIAIFSIMLTVITILKHQTSKLDLKIQVANDLRNKLQYDLSFLKSEWEYLSSPENIEKLSNVYLNYQQTSLIKFEDFLKILDTKVILK